MEMLVSSQDRLWCHLAGSLNTKAGPELRWRRYSPGTPSPWSSPIALASLLSRHPHPAILSRHPDPAIRRLPSVGSLRYLPPVASPLHSPHTLSSLLHTPRKNTKSLGRFCAPVGGAEVLIHAHVCMEIDEMRRLPHDDGQVLAHQEVAESSKGVARVGLQREVEVMESGTVAAKAVSYGHTSNCTQWNSTESNGTQRKVEQERATTCRLAPTRGAPS